VISDIERGQDVRLKEKNDNDDKKYMVISFDFDNSSQVKIHGLSDTRTEQSYCTRRLAGPASESLVNLVEFAGDFADLSGGRNLFWDVRTEEGTYVRVLRSNNE
jgi:hypothetical protein